MKLKKLAFSIALLVGFSNLTLPALADSQGNFPGKGTVAAWKRSYDPATKALGLSNSGDYQGAVRLDREAISIYPYESSWYHNLGNDLAKLGKIEEARKAHEQAIELEPYFTGAWLSLGETYESQRKLIDAERYYRKALQIKPNSYGALGDLGDILRQQGRFDEAIQYMQRAKKCPENSEHPGQADKFIEMCRQHRKEASN